MLRFTSEEMVSSEQAATFKGLKSLVDHSKTCNLKNTE